MGGRDDTGIHSDLFMTAHPGDGFFLNKIEKFDLHGKGQFADFIQEQRSVIGQLDFTDFAAFCGTGKSAFLVAEELGFKQIFRNGAAVDLDERPFGIFAELMHHFGDACFPCTGFALDQNNDIQRRHTDQFIDDMFVCFADIHRILQGHVIFF